MDEGETTTHWIDGRLLDHTPAPSRPWARVLGVLLLLLGFDLLLGLGPDRDARVREQTPAQTEGDVRLEARRSLDRAVAAAAAGQRSLLLIGDSVLAGDVLAARLPRDWQRERVIEHMRAELAPEAWADVHLEQIALDGLLPVDALHLIAELDRLDPAGEVEVVYELNLRYFSQQYGKQRDCSREALCALAGARVDVERSFGRRLRSAAGEQKAAVLDLLAAHTPVHRRRDRLRRPPALSAIPGLAVARGDGAQAQAEEPGDDLRPQAEGLAACGETPRATSLGLSAEGGVAETCSTPGTTAFRLLPLDENPGARRHVGFHHRLLGRIREHYRSARIHGKHRQQQALVAALERLAARRRPALLFLTPLADGFADAVLPGNQLGQRYEDLAVLVNDRPGGPQLLDLDHPLFVDAHFVDHVHLSADGSRVLALNLLHELGLPMARRPPATAMIHDVDSDRSLLHRRGVGYSDGGAWQAMLRRPEGVASDDDGSWVVLADSDNHMLRQLRGNMQVLERLAGKPGAKGHVDGPALAGARLERPRSPQILAGAVYFLDGKQGQHVRMVAGGEVYTLRWIGPNCPGYRELKARAVAGGRRLTLLCDDGRVLTLELAARNHATLSLRAGARRTIETTRDGRLFFADDQARIWSTQVDAQGQAEAPTLVFANSSQVWLPQQPQHTYPFGFDEMGLQSVVAMAWVERYQALLVADEHRLDTEDKRLQKELHERVHLRLLDLDGQLIWPWIKAIPHADAFHQWNQRTQSMSSYYHQGSMAIVQADASLLWLERARARLLRLGDGMLALAKHGGRQSPFVKVHLLDPLGSEAGRRASVTLRPDRYLERRHEPLAHMRGPYVALLVGSSLSALSDRIGNYSLGRVLERELQIELGYRDRLRLDLYQRSLPAASLEAEIDVIDEFLAGGGPPPDLLLLELHGFRDSFFAGLATPAARRRALGELERLAARYDSLVILYDNSAMNADHRDGLRPSDPELLALIADARALGFIVIEPSHRLLRELLEESPWGNQTWGPNQHHGSPWAIDLTARVLATTLYPLLHQALPGRTPARLRERPAEDFEPRRGRARLAAALQRTEGLVDRGALPPIADADLQRSYRDRRLSLRVDRSRFAAVSDERLALAALYATLDDDIYGELAEVVEVELLAYSSYDEYGEGVRATARSVWRQEFDRAGLERFIRALADGDGGQP